MTRLQLLQARLVQTLHDPPHKALVLGTGVSHTKAALDFSKAVAGRPLRDWSHAPDRLASGADRPVLGSGKEARAYWRSAPVITHPLQPEARLSVSLEGLPSVGGVRAQAQKILDAMVEPWDEEAAPETGLPALSDAGWTDPAALTRSQLALWRNLPELTRALRLPAAFLPADTRCPDHAIESHLRVSAAAAFIEPLSRADDQRDPTQEPVLLQVSVRGVQAYIRESRKARDLWTACMIFTELAWAAMAVIVETYGPEAVLYPDLRENPLMDQWLLAHGHRDAVPERVRRAGAGTFAAPVPNTFCALVPRGGAGGLEAVDALAERCVAAARQRWTEMADSVERLLVRMRGPGPWQEIYQRQLHPSRAPEVVWAAVPWPRRMVGLGDPPAHLAALPGHAIVPDQLPPPLQARGRALQPWLPGRVWRHYQTALTVFWRTDAAARTRYLSGERGFDYAVVHHQLRRVMETRKLCDAVVPAEEPGEKCALTGVHEALSNHPAGERRDVVGTRGAARGFWSTGRDGADPTGADRLGGPGALKRLLARADDQTFVARWRGVRDDAREAPDAPFPSTSALAMGRFLVQIGERWDTSPALRRAASVLLAAHGQIALDSDTLHPLALPRLWPLRQGRPDLDAFCKLEPQYLLPEVARTHAERAAKDSPERARRERYVAALQAFHAACGAEGIQPACTAIAILAMDGDSLSRLVLGDPDTIQARWRDVLHPSVVARIEQEWKDRPDPLVTGWGGLLDQKRTLGPSLHAALTSALAYFTHHIAGWVVEREYGGRLLYAGGDDLLAMLPADEALPCAARLQQLASAPFLLDTAPDTVPWAWRLGGDEDLPSPDGAAERLRFRVPVLARGQALALPDLAWEAHVHPEVPRAAPDWSAPWDLKMMLGRANGLSAGISLGHYKTPLGLLVRAARDALDDIAKKRRLPGNEGPAIKRAVAVTRFTRGGSKYSFCAGWELGGEALTLEHPWRPDPPRVQETLGVVIDGIRSGKLPSRLPYKLRVDLEQLGVALDDQNSHRLLTNLVRINARQADDAQIAAVVALLTAGLERAVQIAAPADRRQAVIAGLLLARDLAQEGATDGTP